jgi:hypothetical protein
MLSATAALAEPAGQQKSRTAPPSAPPSGKLLPLKGAGAGNSCARYGAGFVKVEGADTCVKIGGSVSIGAGMSSGSR